MLQVYYELFAHFSQLITRSVLPMPNISQTGKKEGGNLTRKERFSSLVGSTVETDVFYAFVVVPVACRIRTGNIHENATADTFL
jgi:hypothetical protein